MQIIKDLESLEKPLHNPVLTIGNFDGVHKGHLKLFHKAISRAKAIKGTSAVMTFDPHPAKVMKPGNGPPLITPIGQKLRLIQEAGIEVILCLPFSRKFASREAQDFVKGVLIDKIGIKELVVGYDYTFGHNRQGDINLLQEMGEELDFRVHVVKPVYIENTLVSSTSIRRYVQEGNMPKAEMLLGRYYQISGTVIKGQNRGGRLLGFPTANLRVDDELIPKGGVYAVTVFLNGEIYKGVSNLGYNPTFGENALSVETHLLGFSGDLVGRIIKINFLQRLRDEKKFAGVEELIAQIKRDIKKAKAVFKLREK
jgi:riboflavin kinase/FMN adenylyltransferase